MNKQNYKSTRYHIVIVVLLFFNSLGNKRTYLNSILLQLKSFSCHFFESKYSSLPWNLTKSHIISSEKEAILQRIVSSKMKKLLSNFSSRWSTLLDLPYCTVGFRPFLNKIQSNFFCCKIFEAFHWGVVYKYAKIFCICTTNFVDNGA